MRVQLASLASLLRRIFINATHLHCEHPLHVSPSAGEVYHIWRCHSAGLYIGPATGHCDYGHDLWQLYMSRYRRLTECQVCAQHDQEWPGNALKLSKLRSGSVIVGITSTLHGRNLMPRLLLATTHWRELRARVQISIHIQKNKESRACNH